MASDVKPKRILRRPAVQDRVALTHSQIDNLEKRGQFPKRFKISEKAAGWLESEIEDWITQRIAQSRSGGPVAATQSA